MEDVIYCKTSFFIKYTVVQETFHVRLREAGHMIYKQTFFLNTVFRCHFEISQDAVSLSEALDLKTDCKNKYRPVEIGTETSH